jgi:DNA-binding response OmpR family regulator
MDSWYDTGIGRVPDQREESMGGRVAQQTILVVDDDESLVRALAMRLRAGGYRGLVAMDGLQAVMVAHKQDPDLILLDIRMPAGDGFSVMDKLAFSTKTQHIPVIIVTAFDDELTKSKVDSSAAVAYFRKPFNADELMEAVKAALPNTTAE